MSRALIMGAQTLGLAGVDNDVDDMAAWLRDHKFDVAVRRGGDASCEGMLEGLRALIAAVACDEPAVVYFAGHGGVLEVAADSRSAMRTWQPSVEPARLGYLVPTDYDPDDLCRVLLETVWSAHIVELTRRTRNVVVIHDCCHAAETVRHAPRPRRDPLKAGAPQVLRDGGMRDGGMRDGGGSAPATRSGEPSPHGDRSRDVVAPSGGNAGHGFVGAQTSVGGPLRNQTRSVARTLITADELRDLTSTAGDIVYPLGNPHAVRLVATGSHSLAWEHVGNDRCVRGVLTSNLLAEARAIGDRPTSWAELAGRVRARVLLATQGKQRLEIEGPVHRRLFGLDEAAPITTTTVSSGGGRFVLAAGSLHGVEHGDVYRAIGAASPIAEVTQVRLVESDVAIRHSATRVSEFEAVPVHRTTRFAIAITADDPDARRAVLAALDRCPRLCLEPADRPIARLQIAAGRLSLHDEHGPLGAPVPTDAAGIADVVARLSRLAAGRTLLHIADQFPGRDLVMEVERATSGGDPDAHPEATPGKRAGTAITITVERVAAPASVPATSAADASGPASAAGAQGSSSPAATSAVLGDRATVTATDRLCVRVTSHSQRPLWLHLFAIGPGDAIHALGPVSSGKQLSPWGKVVLGAVPGAQLGGFSLPWPGAPADVARPIDLVMIATGAATDLSSLVLPDLRDAFTPPATPGEPPTELHTVPPPPVTRGVIGVLPPRHAVAVRQRLWLLP